MGQVFVAFSKYLNFNELFFDETEGSCITYHILSHFYFSMKNELHLAFVTSKKAHAKLVDIDATEALADEGVIAFYCHKDIDPKNNLYQMVIAEDEWVFAEDKVLCYAQVHIH